MANALEAINQYNTLADARFLFDAYQSDDDFERSFYECYGLSYRFVAGDNSYDRFVFDFLQRYYKNDFYIRYSFFDKVLSRKKAVSFFEMPIGSSRIDLASVNGNSVGYEIKTEYDSLARLEKQIEDYSMAFEYIYIICPKKNIPIVERAIPDYCGIYSYDSGRTNPAFVIYRHAEKNPALSFSAMLEAMLKEELLNAFGETDLGIIGNSFSEDDINAAFKAALKKRFLGKMRLIQQKTDLLTGRS